MAHWPGETEREDDDGHDKDKEDAFRARRYLRNAADQSQNTNIRLMMGDLRWIEQQAEPFFLGLDWDEDFDDVDDMGPF